MIPIHLQHIYLTKFTVVVRAQPRMVFLCFAHLSSKHPINSIKMAYKRHFTTYCVNTGALR